MDTPTPKISVIVPTYNAARTLGETLHSIFASEYPDFEVIVVDDGSKDNSADVAAQYPCRLLRLAKNIGASRAKNAGAEQAAGDIVFFTDSDCLIRPDALRLIADNLADGAITGVVGLLDTRLRYQDFPSQYKNLWMHFTYLRLPRQVGVFYTSAAAARRSAFAALGGFDSNYTGASVTEDIDLGQRFLTAGHVLVSEKRLLVEHLKHYTWRDLLTTDLWRASALTKILLRKKLAQRGQKQKYYASVPWYFALGVPLSWLAVVFLPAALLWPPAAAAAVLCFLGILLLNLPFLTFLRQQRGWPFFIESCLFLLPDMFVSGLGIVHALLTFLRGKRY
jgi:glycosyltransferase involved in cell wall biosynthesis